MPVREGQTATNPRTGHQIIYQGGRWVNAGSQSGGGARPDATDTKGVQGSAEQRGRVNITFDSALEAHRSMVAQERTQGNPFNNHWDARILEAVPFDSGSVARRVGGQDYQNYESASRSFEAAVLPILSGAAVTESEAKRMIRAALPQMGDTPQTLAQKARRREQMLNGAGAVVGAPVSFPNSRADRRSQGASGPLAGISPLRSSVRQQPRQQPTQQSNRNGGSGDMSRMTDAQLRAMIARGQ